MAQNEDRGRCIKAGELAVVVGAGRSGKAAARLLLRQGARVRLLESNLQALDETQVAALRAEGIELVLGEQGPELFAGAKLVVPSPGLPVVRLREMMGPHADAENTEILAETELAWRALDGEPVLAVTGTSGKTTTVSLAAAMLREQGLRVFLGGNIGTPLSEYLLSGEKADVLVLGLPQGHGRIHRGQVPPVPLPDGRGSGGAGARAGRDRRPFRHQGPQGLDPA